MFATPSRVRCLTSSATCLALKRHNHLPITRAMSVESVLARVSAIEQALADPATLAGLNAGSTGGTAAPLAPEPATASEGASFAQALRSASETTAATTSPASTTAAAPTATGDYLGGVTGAGTSTLAAVTTATPAGTPAVGALGAETPGQRIVRTAESQIGQAEQPPGSNESPAIAVYRTATAGAIPGAPWCAYFASWAARQAGTPLGMSGEGLGSVGQIWEWAQSTGHAIPNGPGVTPQPGDLIVFGDQHVGIVRDVLPNGDIQTIEGNYENKVSANVRTPTEATGYVNVDMNVS